MENINLPITAIIPTFNEEANIAAALDSVEWAEEILVVDSFSTDKTVDIVKSYSNVSLVQHEYKNSATQKNWIIPQAKHEWIFLLDADEYATEPLIIEVKKVLQAGPEHDAYWIRRKNLFMGRKVNYSGWQNDKVIRLFKRDTCQYEAKNVHAEIISEGSVSQLNSVIMHNTYKGLNHFIGKINWYSTWKAYDKIEKGGPTNFFFNVIIKPWYRFFYHYILRLGILDGKVGFIISILNGYDVMLRGIKIWRIRSGEKIEKDK